MIRFLLDTNIVIALFDPQRRDKVISRISRCTPGDVATSIVVAYALYFGAFNSARPKKNLRHFDEFLTEIVPLPLTLDDARTAGEIRAELKRHGTPIGPYDVLIAGQALAQNLVLVSNNSREFSRVKNLQLVDWLI